MREAVKDMIFILNPNHIAGDLGYEAWQADNSMVFAWLINLMEAEVNQNFIL